MICILMCFKVSLMSMYFAFLIMPFVYMYLLMYICRISVENLKTKTMKKKFMYKIQTGWKPKKIFAESVVKKNIFDLAYKLKQGESFFIPKSDATTGAIRSWMKKHTALQTKLFYVMVCGIDKPLKGTRLYRKEVSNGN